MKTIKITSGTFGYLPEGAKSVQIKDCKSEPFDVSDAIADRLIKRGMAESIAAAPDVVVSYDDKMTKAQLMEVGAGIGVDLAESMTKAAMLKALDEAIAAADAAEDPEGDADPEDPEDPEAGTDDAPPAVAPADPA